MWQALGKEGKRWLSVAQHTGVLRALLYKGDCYASGPAMTARLTSPPSQRVQRLTMYAA